LKTQLALLPAAALLAAGLLSAPALADDIFVTEDPGGFFGYTGFDVFPGQSVAARFIPAHDYTFDHVGIWFMSNDFDGTTPQTVTITLRTDVNPGGDYNSAPSEVILETWSRNITAVGWNPVLEPYDSEAHPILHSGQKYWFVAESNVGAGANPVWVWSAEGNEFTGTQEGPGTPWQTGSGAAVGIRVQGTPIHQCSADFNCDGDIGTDSDISDFFACLAGSCPAAPCTSSADFNGDGDVGTDADIEAFFRVLSGGNC
jgi:hypothetical protein